MLVRRWAPGSRGAGGTPGGKRGTQLKGSKASLGHSRGPAKRPSRVARKVTGELTNTQDGSVKRALSSCLCWAWGEVEHPPLCHGTLVPLPTLLPPPGLSTDFPLWLQVTATSPIIRQERN